MVRAPARPGPARSARRAARDVLLNAGEVAFLQCDYPRRRRASRAPPWRWSSALGDQRGAATALQRLGSIAREQARYEDARELHQRSLAIWHELGDAERHRLLARLPGVRRLAARRSEDERGRMRRWRWRSSSAPVTCGPRRARWSTSARLPCTAVICRSPPSGSSEALSIARDLGFQEGDRLVAARAGDRRLGRSRRPPREQVPMLREALLVHRAAGRPLAGCQRARGDRRLGARASRCRSARAEILAAAEALREQLGTPIPPVEAPDRDAASARLSSAG